MLLLTAEDIDRAVSMRDVIEAVKQAFLLREKGEIIAPLRTVIPAENGGMLLYMPAYSPSLNISVLKNVNIFPRNADKGLKTAPAQILLTDAQTGYALALLDGTRITELRTGAATGAAFDMLAKKDCRIGALIGTGGQAECQLRAMLAARPLEEIRIFSRNAEHRHAFVDRMRHLLSGSGCSFFAADSPAACIRDADLIVTATTSPVPVLDGALVKPGATVSCIGAYEPEKREIDDTLLLRASGIFCDAEDAVLAESGDIILPVNRGILPRGAITGNLARVLAGELPGRTTDEEILVFESVGIAAQDLTSAKLIYEKAKAMGLGIEIA